MKKMLMLGTMALSLVAFAVPASAEAEVVWERNHKPLDQTETLEATGYIMFATGLGTGKCVKVDVPIHFTPGSTGVIEAIKVTESTECEATGALEGCEAEEGKLTAPVAIHTSADTETITVTEGKFIYKFHEGCAIEEVELTWDNDDLHLLVDDPTNIHGVTLMEAEKGNAIVHVAGLEMSAQITGSFTLDKTNKDETVGITHVNT